jgi:hypothetical protein
MSEPSSIPPSVQIRKRGLMMFVIGGIIFAGILYLMYWLSAHNHQFSVELIGAGVPFAVSCIGLIELVSGAPYYRLAQAWMGLRGWQRGVLGTLIVVASLVIILLIVTFFVMHFM